MNDYPITIDSKGLEVELKLFSAQDRSAVEAFAAKLPTHDLLFLSRDIQHPKVIDAWIETIEEGGIVSLNAWVSGEVVGTSAIVRDRLGWSAHVAELRLLVAESVRGKGVGRLLLEHSFRLAVAAGAEKLMARMTPDQKTAIMLFEELGFRGEAMLRDYVRDRDGKVHDIVMLSLDVARAGSSVRAYGFTGE